MGIGKLEVTIKNNLDEYIQLIKEAQEVIKRVNDFELEFEIIKEDNWGKKKLAYSIRREEFAVYVYFEVKLPAEALLKISNVLNITDEVLRYLLVKADEKARQALAEQRQRDEEADRAAAEENDDTRES